MPTIMLDPLKELNYNIFMKQKAPVERFGTSKISSPR